MKKERQMYRSRNDKATEGAPDAQEEGITSDSNLETRGQCNNHHPI